MPPFTGFFFKNGSKRKQEKQKPWWAQLRLEEKLGQT